MDLRGLVSTIVSDVAFNVVSDFLHKIRFTAGDAGYDPATRTVLDAPLGPEIRCALVKYSFKERMDANGKVSTSDRKAMIPSSDLPTKPEGSNKAFVDGKWWDVRGVDASTGEMLWIVHLRAA